MKLKQKRAPVRAKSRRPAPRKNSGEKKYTVHTVDAVGSKQSGWEVNDVYSSQGVVTLRDATAAEIFRELKDADLLNSSSRLSGMYVDEQGDQIFVHRRSDGKPIFELRAATMRNSSRHGGALRNSVRDGAEDAIKKHFMPLMPAAVKHQLDGANWDLYNGPLSKSDARAHGIRGWKGFVHATKVLDDWADQHVEKVWYDMQSGYIETSEPQGYEDEETGEWVDAPLEDYIEYDTRDVKRILFGSELARSL